MNAESCKRRDSIDAPPPADRCERRRTSTPPIAAVSQHVRIAPTDAPDAKEIADGAAVQMTLAGCSGAQVELVRRGERTWVRKTAAVAGNRRLAREREKLLWLSTVAHGPNGLCFDVPELGATGRTAGRTWYELAFVPARSAEAIAAEDGEAAGRALGSRLAHVVRTLGQAGEPPRATDHAAFLRQKLNETLLALPTKCAGNAMAEPLRRAFASRATLMPIDAAADAAAAIPGGCHGDLALDNVLESSTGTLVLIDPLASDSESVYWDAAKVMQSTLACWGSVKNGAVELGRSGLIARRPGGLSALHDSFWSALHASGADETAAAVHLVVTLARVMRYVEGRRLVALLAASVELINRLQAGEARLHEPLDSLRGSIQPILDQHPQVSPRDARRPHDAGARRRSVRRAS